jgi:hypothetical protein
MRPGHNSRPRIWTGHSVARRTIRSARRAAPLRFGRGNYDQASPSLGAPSGQHRVGGAMADEQWPWADAVHRLRARQLAAQRRHRHHGSVCSPGPDLHRAAEGMFDEYDAGASVCPQRADTRRYSAHAVGEVGRPAFRFCVTIGGVLVAGDGRVTPSTGPGQPMRRREPEPGRANDDPTLPAAIPHPTGQTGRCTCGRGGGRWAP